MAGRTYEQEVIYSKDAPLSAPETSFKGKQLSKVGWNDLQVIVADLFGTLVSVTFPGGQKVAKFPVRLIQNMNAFLAKGGVLLIDTGDNFHNAKDWFVCNLEQRFQGNVVVLSLSSMVCHVFDSALGEFVELFNLMDFLTQKQRGENDQNWKAFQSLWLKTIQEVVNQKLGQFKEMKVVDGELLYRFEKGQIEDRNYQITLRIDKNKIAESLNLGAVDPENSEKIIREECRRIQSAMDSALKEKFEESQFSELPFSPISSINNDTVIDSLPIFFDKGKELQKLIEMGVVDKVRGNQKTDWRKVWVLGDYFRGNDGDMAKIPELVEARKISFGGDEEANIPGVEHRRGGPEAVSQVLTEALEAQLEMSGKNLKETNL